MRAAESLRPAAGAAAHAAQGSAVPEHARDHVEISRRQSLMHDLDGSIFLQSELAEFHADARTLHSTEGRERLDRPMIVHPGRAAFQPRCDGFRLLGVCRPG